MKSKFEKVCDEVDELPKELQEIFWEDIITAMQNRLKVLRKVK